MSSLGLQRKNQNPQTSFLAEIQWMQEIQSLIKDRLGGHNSSNVANIIFFFFFKLLLTAVLHSHVEWSIKDYLSTKIQVTSFTSEAEQDTHQLFPKSVGRLVKIEAKACQAHRSDKIQPIYWSAGRYILTCNNELWKLNMKLISYSFLWG